MWNSVLKSKQVQNTTCMYANIGQANIYELVKI